MIFLKNLKKINIYDEKEKKEKNDNDDKKEIENLFEGINVNYNKYFIKDIFL